MQTGTLKLRSCRTCLNSACHILCAILLTILSLLQAANRVSTEKGQLKSSMVPTGILSPASSTSKEVIMPPASSTPISSMSLAVIGITGKDLLKGCSSQESSRWDHGLSSTWNLHSNSSLKGQTLVQLRLRPEKFFCSGLEPTRTVERNLSFLTLKTKSFNYLMQSLKCP